MKKRITALFCFLCLLLPLFSGLQTVRADVIFEPENSFYVSHADNCLYHNRSYTTPGDTEYYAAPGDALAAGSLKAGEQFLVSWLYRDSSGRDWGYFEQYSPDRSGWLLMENMCLVYDSEAFMDDHWDELDRNDAETIPAGTAVNFWSYPGARQSYSGYEALPDDLEVSALYTDSAERQWGYCAYFYGDRDFWVCLSDPAAGELSSDTEAEQKPYDAPEELTADPEPLNSSPNPVVLLIVLPVAAVIMASILLLRKFRKKKNNN